jgi:Leucine-rich repeat (LRR) protein
MQPGTEMVQLCSIVCYSILTLFTSTHASPSNCPSHCLCSSDVIDCSNRRLSSLQDFQTTHASSANSFNLSFNALTTADELSEFSFTVYTLDLSFNEISGVSSNVFAGESFAALKILNLTGNKLKSFEFSLPSSLTDLRLGQNELEHVCVERLKNLSSLRTLSLQNNGLKALSVYCGGDEVGSKKSEKHSTPQCPYAPLHHLTELDLQGNKLTALQQDAVDCFQSAHSVSFAQNFIKTIPPKLFHNFRHLRYLDLSENSLTKIPEGIFKHLDHLKFLSLAGNRLAAVPAGLPMVEWLDLSNNAITRIPESHKPDLYPQVGFLPCFVVVVVVSSSA